MKINRAIGLGLMLLILQLTASGIWTAFENTLIGVLNVTQSAFGAVGHGVGAHTFTNTFPAFSTTPEKE